MRSRYLIANWKMNIPPEGIEAYMRAMASAPADPRMVIAPPHVFVDDAVKIAKGVAIGAQNCGDYPSGAYTGEVSAMMLHDVGVKFVILGHSERRTHFHETEAMIARKLALVIETGPTPVLCIGEDLRVREAGHVARFLADQIRAVAVPQLERAAEIVIAYEPIWAIGTGRNASARQVAETVAEVRDAVSRFWPVRFGDTSPILYGGSVTPDNTRDIASNGHVDGFLVGGASLDSAKFLAIGEQMRAAVAAP